MKRKFYSLSLMVAGLVGSLSLAVVPVSAANTAANGSNSTTASQAKLKVVITRGDNEINRRLNSLKAVLNRLNAAQKLSASDKSSLTDEVNTETSGLTTLKAQLDAETTVDAAKADDQSILNDYRVYALTVPKINLVVTADAQLVTEGKLSDLATKLSTRLSTSTSKNVSALQAKLTDMTSQISKAQAISSAVEASVINLQPSDYNSNHAVLSGDRDQLKTAQADIKAAVSDAHAIVSGLKS